MMEDNAISNGMIKLDASNYYLQKPMMEDLLYCKDLYEPIVRDKISTSVKEEDWRVLNRKALSMIRLYINHNIFHHVANDTNTYDLWHKLESMYEQKTTLNKASVIKWLAKLEYRDGSSIIEHLNVFQGHVN
uniref:Retrovirus-related Pol polyprotein from transposon TNT 1-94 n=1 Tax=Arundo donax TaxID=35708 RepID=A0A0A9B7D2_ARUDO